MNVHEGEIMQWKGKWWEDESEAVLGNSHRKPPAQTPARGSDLLPETRLSNTKDLTATSPSEREMEATRGTKVRLRLLVNPGWHIREGTWNLRDKGLVQNHRII